MTRNADHVSGGGQKNKVLGGAVPALAGNPNPIRCGGKKSKVLNVYYVPKSLNSRESSTRE
jgi:hypothetical protein